MTTKTIPQLTAEIAALEPERSRMALLLSRPMTEDEYAAARRDSMAIESQFERLRQEIRNLYERHEQTRKYISKAESMLQSGILDRNIREAEFDLDQAQRALASAPDGLKQLRRRSRVTRDAGLREQLLRAEALVAGNVYQRRVDDALAALDMAQRAKYSYQIDIERLRLLLIELEVGR